MFVGNVNFGGRDAFGQRRVVGLEPDSVRCRDDGPVLVGVVEACQASRDGTFGMLPVEVVGLVPLDECLRYGFDVPQPAPVELTLEIIEQSAIGYWIRLACCGVNVCPTA